MFALLPMRSLFLTMFLSFDDDDDEKEDIFCKNNRWKKVNTERVKKSFLFALFYPKLLFVLLFRHSSLFFVHSGFFFGITERKNRDVFIDTHTHRIKSSQRRASSER